MTQLTDDSFLEQIQDSKLIAIKAYADWCQPCKNIAPIFAEMADLYESEVKCASINVDTNPVATSHFGIRGLPTILFIKDGKVVSTLTGNQPRPKLEYEFRKLVD